MNNNECTKFLLIFLGILLLLLCICIGSAEEGIKNARTVGIIFLSLGVFMDCIDKIFQKRK